MAFNPLSGVTGSVKIGALSYAFGKWTLAMKSNALIVNNFTGGGYQQVTGGVLSADLTLDALTYDQGNMPFSCGTTYTFILGYNATTTVTVAIFIESIEPTVDYDGAQPIKISGKSNGPFTAAIA
jgi:hypothetical protein